MILYRKSKKNIFDQFLTLTDLEILVFKMLLSQKTNKFYKNAKSVEDKI